MREVNSIVGKNLSGDAPSFERFYAIPVYEG